MTEITSIFKASSVSQFLHSYSNLLKKIFGAPRVKQWAEESGMSSRVTFKQYTTGKRPLPKAVVHKLEKTLDFSESEKMELKNKLDGSKNSLERNQSYTVSPEFFRSPINTIILNLCGIQAQMTHQKIISVLANVSAPANIDLAIKALLDLNLVIESADGHLIRIFEGSLSTVPGQKSAASQNYFKESFALADKAWDLPLEIRELSAFTFRLKTEDIPKMKDIVRNFRKDLSSLHQKEISDCVYQCSVAAFPIYLESAAHVEAKL